MKKIATLFVISLFITALKAQHSDFNIVPVKPFKGVSTSGADSKPNAACDTLNYHAASNRWHALIYPYGDSGYIFGTSGRRNGKINEDANYFDVSASGYNYITGGLVYFGIANSNITNDLNRAIIFNIYDDSAGLPGLILGSIPLRLSKIHQDVLNHKLTEFRFLDPIAIPASKKFYVSIDHSHFAWTLSQHDSIAIVANRNDDTTGAAYQEFRVGGTTFWRAVNQFWTTAQGDPLDVNLFIFPYVSTSLDGCAVLPVSMFNFGGIIKNYDAYLNWSTATENNNKGFYVERSKDGQNFASIGFVKGVGNSSTITNYTYTDYLIKDLNITTTYYRLKQVDLDGKYSYSNVLALNMKNLFQYRLYPNPVKDVGTVELSLETVSKVNVQVISHDGKIVLNSDKGVMTQGTQQVFINTQNLAKGTYIAHITAGDKTYNVPFVKQ
jgi:hypothetical protein